MQLTISLLGHEIVTLLFFRAMPETAISDLTSIHMSTELEESDEEYEDEEDARAAHLRPARRIGF